MLASVVPLLVIAWVTVVDLESALIMLLTLPLVPVFMWLIGRYTEHRTRERWDALRLLSTHFLDVVRGLPTLRAFGRARAQAETVSTVSERYRKTTMETLRVSFLSGSVLELAARERVIATHELKLWASFDPEDFWVGPVLQQDNRCRVFWCNCHGPKYSTK